MTSQAFIIESQKIAAVATLEEIAELSSTILDDGDIANLSFPHPRIYRLVRAIDTLAHAALAEQGKLEANLSAPA